VQWSEGKYLAMVGGENPLRFGEGKPLQWSEGKTIAVFRMRNLCSYQREKLL
jgi:hypothetical protein